MFHSSYYHDNYIFSPFSFDLLRRIHTLIITATMFCQFVYVQCLFILYFIAAIIVVLAVLFSLMLHLLICKLYTTT